jgi:DNA-binding NtrC family response regulator
MERRKSVLVLDFDDDMLIALERVLEDSGFSTTATWDVEEALALLRKRHFDFLVLGNRPPRLDAQAILANARKEGLKFGAFVLPRSRASKDGYSHLVDRIRDFPCCPERPQKTAHKEAVA